MLFGNRKPEFVVPRIARDGLARLFGLKIKVAKSFAETWIAITNLGSATCEQFPPKPLILNDRIKEFRGVIVDYVTQRLLDDVLLTEAFAGAAYSFNSHQFGARLRGGFMPGELICDADWRNDPDQAAAILKQAFHSKEAVKTVLLQLAESIRVKGGIHLAPPVQYSS